MDDLDTDLNSDMMLDGNAAAGLLQELFALEMTTVPAECAHCGNIGEIGSLLCFSQAPGMILRCPACEQIILRIVRAPYAIFFHSPVSTHFTFAQPPTLYPSTP